jgi:cyclase
MKRTTLFALLFAAGLANAQDDYSKVTVTSEKINASTYMLTGDGGNIGVSIGPDAVFVIDDQFAPLSAKIKAAIGKLSKKPIRFLVNTHFHGDHTGGNANFMRDGATIFAQDNVRTRMLAKPDAAMGAPIITFAEDMTFHINGEDLHVVHLPPGHTDTDAIVHFKGSNVIHAGDLFFNGMYPFIDLNSGGHPDGVVAAVDKVLALADDKTRIIPGHGPLGGKAELLAYRDMLATISARVKALAAKPLADVQATDPTQGFDEKWGKGFLRKAELVEMLWKAYQPK